MTFTLSTVPAFFSLASAGAVAPQEAGMEPTDEQIDRAIEAFDQNWRKRPDITVKNFAAARRDAMRAALQAVFEQGRTMSTTENTAFPSEAEGTNP